MAENKKGGSVVNTVWALAEPIVKDLGLILWDVKFVKEGVNRYLRIIIDKAGGVGIDDCVAVNDALDAPLDEADPIDGSYNLQVQSPGIERELVRDFHFASFMNEKATVKLRSAIDGSKTWSCIIRGCAEGSVKLEFPDGSIREFTKKDYSTIRLDDFDDSLLN